MEVTTLVWGSILVDVPIKEKLLSKNDIWKGYSYDKKGNPWAMVEGFDNAELYVCPVNELTHLERM